MLKSVIPCFLLATLLLSATDADAQIYRLTPETQYFEGCLSGLCLCPVQVTSRVEGTMSVVRRSSDEFIVVSLYWEVFADSAPLRFKGQGLYWRRGGPFMREQRMQLELSANGGEGVIYDSGWGPLRNHSDVIDVDLPMAEIVCYGSAFQLHAVPLSRIGIEEGSWSTIKSRW